MFTPQEAADRSGVSRKTIMDAIDSKKLNAIRDNRNRWQIGEDDLKRWMDSRTPRRSKATITTPLTAPSADGTVRIAVLEVEASGLRSQLTKSEEEITRLREQLAEVETKAEAEVKAVREQAKADKAEMREQLAKVETKAEAEKAELKQQLMEEKADRRTLQDRLNEAPRRRSLMGIIFGK